MVAQPTPFSWPDGINVAVSLTFDDARQTQLDRGVPILDRFGLHGTFYASILPLEERAGDWRAAREDGHEIGNHTVSHPCSGNFVGPVDRALENFTLERIEADILEASVRIEESVGTVPTSFAYPCGERYVGRGVDQRSYVPVVARHFVAGRTFMSEWPADPGFCDLANLPGISFDDLPWENVKALLDRARNRGGWLILAGHEVGEARRQGVRPDVLEELGSLASDPANGIWIDTVSAIAEFIRDSRNSHKE